MIRYLAVIGTLAAFAGAPAMAQQPTAPGQVMHKSSVSKSVVGLEVAQVRLALLPAMPRPISTRGAG